MAKSNSADTAKRATRPKGAQSSAARKSTVKAKPSSKKKTKNGNSALSPRTKQEIRAITFVFLCFLLVMSYYTPFFGVVGGFVKGLGMALFGPTAYIVPVFAAIAGFHMLVKGTLKPHTHRYVAAILACVCISGLFAVHSHNLNPSLFGDDYTPEELVAATQRNPGLMMYEYSNIFGVMTNIVLAARDGLGGGLCGFFASLPFIRLVSPIGTVVLFWALLLAFIALATGKTPFIRAAEWIRGKIEASRAEAEEEPVFGEIAAVDYGEKKPVRKTAPKKAAEKPEKGKSAVAAIKDKLFQKEEPTAASKPKKKKKRPTDGSSSVHKVEPKLVTPEKGEQVKIKLFDSQPEDVPEDIMEMAMAESGAVKEEKAPEPPIPVTDDEIDTDFIPYKFPPVKLLGKDKPTKDNTSQEDVRRMGQKLIETLRSFGVEAKINEITKGPAITRFEISPAAGVKVNKIVNLANDIALNLAAVSVRVIAPIPGKAAVGIEIPNETVSMVRLRDVIDTEDFRSFKSKTAFALGKDVNGRVRIADISKMPHLLIAGATGSGKSVCINSLITSIIYKADPNEVKLIMIDPKVVELGVYNGIPHLLIPVVTDPRRAAGALNWAVQEMIKRYKLFAENNVRNLAGYNELAELSGERKLEQIIIIVDELADLMMVSAKEVEDSICRLAQMARAAGMYLVIATQRPSVDVITGLIKANVPSRIAFSVSNQIDSRTILDMGGAEKLLGKGDMLFLPMGANTPVRIQGAFVSDKETEEIVEYVKQDFTAKYDEDVMEHIERGAEPEGGSRDDGGDADEMLPAAIQAVVEAGQASASLLQRRLKVGYARAGRLIDQLEERGIIGPHEGSKPRAVLISRSQLLEMEAAGNTEN